MPSDYRETLENLLEVDAIFDDCSTAKPLHPDEADAIREALAEVERLKARADAAAALRDDALRNCNRLQAERAEDREREEQRCAELADRIDAALVLLPEMPHSAIEALKGE